MPVWSADATPKRSNEGDARPAARAHGVGGERIMEYGINLLLWTSHVTEAHDGVLEMLREARYDRVEIPIFELDVEHYARLGRRLDELDLKRTASTIRTEADNPIALDADCRARALAQTRRTIDCVAALGGTALVGPFHSALGTFSGAPRTDDEWRFGVEHMQHAAEHARAHGIRLSVEFLNRFECYFLNTAEDTARFCEDVGADNVGILYDTFHAHIEEKDPAGAIAAHAGWINHVHVSENDRSTPGRGQVRWGDTFDALAGVGYAQHLVVEAFGGSLPDIAAATKIWRKMFDSEEQLATDGLAFMQAEWRRRGG